MKKRKLILIPMGLIPAYLVSCAIIFVVFFYPPFRQKSLVNFNFEILRGKKKDCLECPSVP